MSGAQSRDVPDLVVAIRMWHAIEPPHPSAVEFAKDVQAMIAGFQAMPAPDFQSESADFLLVLEALGE